MAQIHGMSFKRTILVSVSIPIEACELPSQIGSEEQDTILENQQATVKLGDHKEIL